MPLRPASRRMPGRAGARFRACWPDAQAAVSGRFSVWARTADSGHKVAYRFCPDCGSTLTYVIEGWPGVTAIPLGAFADPSFPPPRFSVSEHRKHAWVQVLGDEVEHSGLPAAKAHEGSDVASRGPGSEQPVARTIKASPMASKVGHPFANLESLPAVL